MEAFIVNLVVIGTSVVLLGTLINGIMDKTKSKEFFLEDGLNDVPVYKPEKDDRPDKLFNL